MQTRSDQEGVCPVERRDPIRNIFPARLSSVSQLCEMPERPG